MQKKKWSLILALILIVSLTAGWGKKSAAETPVKFKLAHSTWVGYGPLYIAKEEGYFKKYNIDPQLTIIEDESQYASALFSNNIQGLGNVLDREVIHFSKGTPEKFVFAMDESTGGDGIIAKKEIKTIQDLKGATIGMDKSSTSYFFFLSVLKKNGVAEKDVKIREMGAGEAGAAFVAGKLDAAVSWEPWLTNAGKRKGGHVLVSSKDYPHTIVDVVTLRSDFVDKHPKAVLGLTKAWFDAVDFYKKNPEKGNEIIGKALSLKSSEVKSMVKGVSFFDKSKNVVFFDKNKNNNVYELAQRAGDFWTQKKIIDKNIDVDKLIDNQFIQEAVK